MERPVDTGAEGAPGDASGPAPRRGRPRRVRAAGTDAAPPPQARRGRRPRTAAPPVPSVVEEIVSRVQALVADNERLRQENAALHGTLTQLTDALSGIAPRRRGRPRRRAD